MNPTDNLVMELAKDIDIPFLLTLMDLIPDIKTHYFGNLLENMISLEEDWIGYEKIREKDTLLISKIGLGSSFFRFAINFSSSDWDLPFYGIIGRWDKRNLNKEIDSVYNLIKPNIFDNEWTDSNKNIWINKYFIKDYDSIFNAIKNGQSPRIAVEPIINEFFFECNKLKPIMERINEILAKP